MLKLILNSGIFVGTSISTILFLHNNDKIKWSNKSEEIHNTIYNLTKVSSTNVPQFSENIYLKYRTNFLTKKNFTSKNQDCFNKDNLNNEKNSLNLNNSKNINLNENFLKDHSSVNILKFNKKSVLKKKNKNLSKSPIFTLIDNQAAYLSRFFFDMKPVVTSSIKYDVLKDLNHEEEYCIYSFTNFLRGKNAYVNSVVFDEKGDIVMMFKSRFVCIDWYKF